LALAKITPARRPTKGIIFVSSKLFKSACTCTPSTGVLCVHAIVLVHFLLLSKLKEEMLPNKMLAEFCKLVGTWNRRMPATDRGILFSDPTRLQIKNHGLEVPLIHLSVIDYCLFFNPYLYVVAPVWWRNHIEVKLIARPKKPLNVTTNQKVGNLKSGLPKDYDI
jgi:hypothetical protein